MDSPKCNPISDEVWTEQYTKLLRRIYLEAWGLGIVTSINKKGSTLDPNNYRGITVSSCLGKGFGTILKKRLNKYCDENNIIDDRQQNR